MKKYLILTSALALMALAATSCGDDKNDQSGSNDNVVINDSEYDAVINQYVDAVILPTYADLVSKNTDLYNAVIAFGNDRTDAKFSAVAEAWLNARTPWETSEAFLFGPVADKGLDPNMDSWPLDADAIDQIMKSGNWNGLIWNGEYEPLNEDDEDASSEHAKEIAAVQSVRGFHTLEFLCFRDGEPRTINQSAKSTDARDIVYNSSNADGWVEYMRQVALLLQNDALTLNNAWKNGYAATFKAHKNSDYASGLSCIEQIIDGCIDIASEVGSQKIGEPYRLYQSGKTTEALYAVESWYSWHSREDYRNNIYSIRNAYYGSLNGTVNANSISALTAKYNPSLDKKVKAAIDAAANAIMDIPQPFRNNINSAEANAAMEACADLQDVLEKDLKSFLTNHTR